MTHVHQTIHIGQATPTAICVFPRHGDWSWGAKSVNDNGTPGIMPPGLSLVFTDSRGTVVDTWPALYDSDFPHMAAWRKTAAELAVFRALKPCRVRVMLNTREIGNDGEVRWM